MNAGKGDSPRPVNMSKYQKNFDEINWNSKKEKCGSACPKCKSDNCIAIHYDGDGGYQILCQDCKTAFWEEYDDIKNT